MKLLDISDEEPQNFYIFKRDTADISGRVKPDVSHGKLGRLQPYFKPNQDVFPHRYQVVFVFFVPEQKNRVVLREK